VRTAKAAMNRIEPSVKDMTNFLGLSATDCRVRVNVFEGQVRQVVTSISSVEPGSKAICNGGVQRWCGMGNQIYQLSVPNYVGHMNNIQRRRSRVPWLVF
jgi:hypothetical protein